MCVYEMWGWKYKNGRDWFSVGFLCFLCLSEKRMTFLGSMCCVFFYLFFVLFYITATGIFRWLGKGNGILEQQDRFWVIGIRPFYIMEL